MNKKLKKAIILFCCFSVLSTSIQIRADDMSNKKANIQVGINGRESTNLKATLKGKGYKKDSTISKDDIRAVLTIVYKDGTKQSRDLRNSEYNISGDVTLKVGSNTIVVVENYFKSKDTIKIKIDATPTPKATETPKPKATPKANVTPKTNTTPKPTSRNVDEDDGDKTTGDSKYIKEEDRSDDGGDDKVVMAPTATPYSSNGPNYTPGPNSTSVPVNNQLDNYSTASNSRIHLGSDGKYYNDAGQEVDKSGKRTKHGMDAFVEDAKLTTKNLIDQGKKFISFMVNGSVLSITLDIIILLIIIIIIYYVYNKKKKVKIKDNEDDDNEFD